MADEKRFNEQMQAFGRWKADLTTAIDRYREWLLRNGLEDPEEELRLHELVAAVRSDRLTIAFVAEFARGKTELINAIFFSEYDRRLLPSSAGRTTMCPTELFYDHEHGDAYIRLLPIETRLEERSIAEYKQEPEYWSALPLDLDDAASMAEAFQEVVRVKKVDPETARRLGLYSDQDASLHSPDGRPPKVVEVPMWRHALISFPHPLLRQGLVILDTPGLNSLGSEPELTINMLPNAQAVVFVLAADTGVTKSDMAMWQAHVKPLTGDRNRAVLVVLNKVDALWDELKPADEVQRAVADQCRRAAQTLSIDATAVLPASAQKGLLAKIRHDPELLARSNIGTIEAVLGQQILPSKQGLLRAHVSAEIGGMVRESFGLVASRLEAASKQLDELKDLSGKNDQVIEHLMTKTREEQVAYHKNVESFQANKRILAEQSALLLERLSLKKLDELVAHTREEMTGSWTTHGLRLGMKAFFEGVTVIMGEVSEFADQLNRLVTTVYRKFHQEHGITELEPVLYDPTPFRKELKQLYDEAEQFRKSPVTTMTEQSFVVKKFFISLVSHARNVFFKAHREAEKWSKAVMTPLVRQIKDHKRQMEKRLDNLRKIHESRDTLAQRIEELEKSVATLSRQYAEIEAIHRLIARPADNGKAAAPAEPPNERAARL